MRSGGLIRAWLLALLALVIWFVTNAANVEPAPRGAGAPATEFSAARAYAALARVLGPQRPHPVGSMENAAVRARIVKEFARMGIDAKTYRAFSCTNFGGFGFRSCATVTDIVADAIPGNGKAILLAAHYDSVPAGPGASDDGSGVATVLEAVRALRATGGQRRHPVMTVLTDGEEAGLLGAKAFLENAALRQRVGAVVNVEARGTRGQSILFQTSPGDGHLIDLYAAHVPRYATSSLYAEIYKYLPNDTDLTLFIRSGFPSFNFAFAENVRYYHSPRDTLANLSPGSLQMDGDNAMGVVRGLEQADYGALKDDNAIYMSVFGVWLPRIPAALSLPLSVLAFLAIGVAAWLTRDRRGRWMPIATAAAMPVAMLVGCAALGFLLAFIAQAVSHRPDPTYAYPIAMRIALGFGVWGVTLLVSRMASAHAASASAWLWTAGLAVLAAALLPGLSPYFLFPSIVAAALLFASAIMPGRLSAAVHEAFLLGAAVVVLIVWMGLIVSGETVMGLKLHPLFTVPAAFALMTLLPLLAAHPMAREWWIGSVSFSLAIAIVGAIVAGLLPAYSAASPQRVNLAYFERAGMPSRWIAATSWKATRNEELPRELMKAAEFKFDSDAYAGLHLGDGYVAPAGPPHYPVPTATILERSEQGREHVVKIRLRGSARADAMLLHIPKEAELGWLALRGKRSAPPKGWSGDTTLLCAGLDCRDLTIEIALRRPATLTFAEQRYGFPDFGNWLKAKRPANAMPSQSGDNIILANTLAMPGR